MKTRLILVLCAALSCASIASALTIIRSDAAHHAASSRHKSHSASHGRPPRRGNHKSSGNGIAIEVWGGVHRPLYPGGRHYPVDVWLRNLHGSRLKVHRLTMRVLWIHAPRASRALPCTAADFGVRNYRGPAFSIPPRTSDLAGDRVPTRRWPKLWMRDRPVDQDGCVGATVKLSYRVVVQRGRS